MLIILTVFNVKAQTFNENIISDTEGADFIYAIDIDNDGNIDVLSASINDDKIAWYQNDGSGNFGSEQIISTNADGASYVFASDLDNDGDVDVISASRNDDKIAWYENDGLGNFGSEQIISSNADGAMSIHVADINNDGFIDVLSASFYDNKIAWYENDGSGNFGSEQIISTNVLYATSVFAIDLDNDGNIEIIAASAGNNNIVYFKDSLGSLYSEHIISNNADYPYSIYATDINNDGNIDILISDLDSYLKYHKNVGSSNYASVLVSDLSPTYSVYAEDIDNDGNMDIISASTEDNKIVWYNKCNSYSTINVEACDSYLSPSGYMYTNSGTYVDVIQNNEGCDSIITINLTINNSIEIINQPMNIELCENDTAIFSILVTGTNISYQWKKNGIEIIGANSNSLIINNAELYDNGNYVCDLINTCDTLISNVVTLTVTPLPIIDLNTNYNQCVGSSTTIIANVSSGTPPYDYNWYPIGNTSSITVSPANTNTYTLVVTDNKSCKDTAETIVNVLAPFQEQICMVTVDTISGKNLIIWEKTAGMRTEKYHIYRESVVSGVFNLIGEQLYDEISEFVDSTSNPNTQAYKYKINTVDSVCANESNIDSCIAHKTIHLQASQGIPNGFQLFWTEYEGFPYNTYKIYGREIGIGNYTLVHQTAFGNNTWTDLTTVENMEYIISIEKDTPCFPSSSLKNTKNIYNQSISNVGEYSTDINSISNIKNIYIYPNPCSGRFTVRAENLNKIIITDIKGNIIYVQDDIVEFNNIDLSKETKAVYFVKLISKSGVSTQKIVLE